MSNPPILQIDKLTKVIKNKTIVEPFSLAMKEGEVIALCGGNGAGKSTIIRMIVGLTQPTAGSIHLCGYAATKHRKKIADLFGYMPDDFQFTNGLTAYETLQFYAKLKQASKKNIDELLAQVGLYEVRGKKVNTFSKGMRQRLIFAQALLSSPPLLILDEPTNGLDPFWMDSFVTLMKLAKENNQSVLFSSHQLHIAEQVADKLIFLNEGHILAQGETKQFQEQYGENGLHGAFSKIVMKETN
ncbi:ABC transporter ATP-binding protein [Longirhabdus pacifica]|uniref:ABC transporter ATP-binding protein n=1 Tax=Longirhabdus pacifica TaxID=2305227 RepID=UPI001F0B763C|nr:ABC transporter ATP-binding protein [Longirhabdus pacifica]